MSLGIPVLKTSDDVATAIETGNAREYLHLNLELKQKWAQDYGDKISALSNKLDQATTFLVVGVADDGVPTGRDEKWAKETEAILSQQLNERLDPLQACKSISCKRTAKGWLVIVTIQNAGEVTYWGDHAYCASGTTTKRMEPNEILKLRIQLPGLIDYSNQYHKSAYDETLVRRFADFIVKRGHPSEKGITSQGIDEVLRKLGLFERQAARLLFGKGTYRLIRYNNQEQPISNEKREALISLLLPEVITAFCQEGGGNFSEGGLKEALANAVAHAAYFEQDGEIMVEVYPDRITVSNLCIKESTYFANRWLSRSHKTINGLLMETLRIAGLVDELGRGKNLIFSESIKSGKRPPEVHIEGAGKYQRWKLTVYGGREDDNVVRLLDRCRQIYGNEQKALIALALVLWRDRPVTEIRDYIDGDFARQVADVLTGGNNGPIFYYRDEERIRLTRWAEVLLGEGKDSKALSPAEDERLQRFAYKMCSEFHGGTITPKLVRELAQMGDTRSEKTRSSTMLAEWAQRGTITKTGKGKYTFTKNLGSMTSAFEELLTNLQEQPQPPTR
jgi:predicted HTH transcriptional regulator